MQADDIKILKRVLAVISRWRRNCSDEATALSEAKFARFLEELETAITERFKTEEVGDDKTVTPGQPTEKGDAK